MFGCLAPNKYSFSSPTNPEKWIEKSDFKSRGSLVLKCDIPYYLNSSPCMRLCMDGAQVVRKYLRPIVTGDRILRTLLGIALVVLSLGLALIFRPVRKLFTKTHYSTKLLEPVSIEDLYPEKIPPRRPSAEPIISFQDLNLKALENAIVSVIKKDLSQDLKLYPSRGLVFSLNAFPGWILKTKPKHPETITKKWQLNQKIKTLCKQHDFKHIILPESYLLNITIDGIRCPVILEEKLDFEDNIDHQEILYWQNKEHLQQAVTEMTSLVCLTEIGDIRWDNCPVIFDTYSQTYSRIALIDTEPQSAFTSEKVDGLYGGPNRGWLCCLSPVHFPKVKSILKKYNKSMTIFDKAVRQRCQELQRALKLQNWYKQRNIKINTPLVVNINSLDLDLEQRATNPLLSSKFVTFTMKQAVENVVAMLNKHIQTHASSSSHPSLIQRSRQLSLIDTKPSKLELNHYHMSGRAPIFETKDSSSLPMSHQSCLLQILKALVKQNCVFEIMEVTDNQVIIQV